MSDNTAVVPFGRHTANGKSTRLNASYETRHIGITDTERATMLAALGYRSLEELCDAAVPTSLRLSERLELDPPLSEADLTAELRQIAACNESRIPMVGLGYARSHTPAVIRRNVLENPAWYTAYTPYQPEISQGRLEALLVFQTMIEDLTGLPIANASLLDEPTAAAEAMALARRVSKCSSEVFLVDADTHPQTLAVLQTRAEPIGIRIRTLRFAEADGSAPTDEAGRVIAAGDYFGALLSYPGSSGLVAELAQTTAELKKHDAVVAVCTDLLALTMLNEPGRWGADIAVGSAQRFGVPLGFGGPHAAFMAVRKGLERAIPGRLVGVSTDSAGQPAYRLALQTREQHIRREKATSNICTSQVLLAIVSAFYAAFHGPEGLRQIAEHTHAQARALAAGLRAAGAVLEHERFFDTITLRVPNAQTVIDAISRHGIDVRVLDENRFSVSADETTTATVVEALVTAASLAMGVDPLHGTPMPAIAALPDSLLRTTDYLTHPSFNQYHSETAMMRWLRRLSDLDLALDRSMIPLGSCTMKLNAATAMEPISWPGFADIHPFAPSESTEGYTELIARLEGWLADITGYHRVCVQPNAGSQGEFAGLLAIRGYHRATGGAERNVCLIPSSAHGTNAASAAMAGMRVVVVPCRDDGGVDLTVLRSKVDEHADQLAAIMLTYPSTFGVYEDTIGEVCAMVHEAGGQVYVDGANLNALVGLAAPGDFGADVSHLNLHKTFCIPHGGGGPGVGPIGVQAHLVPYLPSHPFLTAESATDGRPTISGAPYGSAGILPIPYAYIRMMGAQGLLHATQNAVLSANYIAARLKDCYPILYTGNRGLVAHECILDLREITRRTGVTVDDVAKRLIDYGLHAPTMSFPVAGTLMVEPTESEDFAEIDRFCQAMISIHAEIEIIADGQWELEDSPLRRAPHTAAALLSEQWPHPYPRTVAAYPRAGMQRSKYWAPVGRIDGAYGDRNLVCSCPPLAAFT
ncbi:MAG: aminomethyl-transferring glycine dehydrogenase [Actinomycetes bacterium]